MGIQTRKVGDTLLIPDSVCAIRFVAVIGDCVKLDLVSSEQPADCLQPVNDPQSGILRAGAKCARTGPIQVLLFDSNPSVAWTQSVIGDRLEIEIEVVGELDACVEHLVTSRPDVLVIDTYSLNWRSESLLAVLSKESERSQIPIILLGGALCGLDREQTKRLNVVNRMRKPVDADRLWEGIATMFAYQEWRSGRSELPARPAANNGQMHKDSVWSGFGFRKRRPK